MDSLHGRAGRSSSTLPVRPAYTDEYEPQTCLILVGLPGSGKSTFAESLVRLSDTLDWAVRRSQQGLSVNKRRRWIRACQDETPSKRRQECELIVRRALHQGHNIVVDRVNFDAQQRSHFVALAEEQHPRPQVHALIFEVSAQSLQERLSFRTDHPTIKDETTARRVLHEMLRLFNPPTPTAGEGFDRIFTLGETEQPMDGAWSVAMLLDTLWKVQSMGQQEEGSRVSLEPRILPQRHWAASRGRGGNFPRGNYGRPFDTPPGPRGGSWGGSNGADRGHRADWRGGRGGRADHGTRGYPQPSFNHTPPAIPPPQDQPP